MPFLPLVSAKAHEPLFIEDIINLTIGHDGASLARGLPARYRNPFPRTPPGATVDRVSHNYSGRRRPNLLRLTL